MEWTSVLLFIKKWWMHLTFLYLVKAYLVYSLIRVRLMYKSWTGCWRTGDWVARTDYLGPLVSYPAIFFSLQLANFFGPQED